MFRVKICGVTSLDDGLLCADAGADAIGLNFYPRSSRYVPPSEARKIASRIPSTVAKVGVFVNAAIDEVIEICGEVGLDAVQLHGDESPWMVRQLGAQNVIKAFRCDDSGLRPVTDCLHECEDLGCRLSAVLIDAHQGGSYGGTGQVAPWPLVRRLCDLPLPIPVILAGGLRPENVAAAIQATRPAAVDTASGVESSPRRKDPRRVRLFIRNAQAAFESLAALVRRPD